MAGLAAEVARQTGKPVVYKDLPQAEYAKAFTGFGLPEGLAGAIADADAGASRGELNTQSHDLSTLMAAPQHLCSKPSPLRLHVSRADTSTTRELIYTKLECFGLQFQVLILG